MDRKDVELGSVKEYQHDYLLIRSFKLRFKTYAGEWSPWLPREVIKRAQAVGVVLYDPERQQVVLIEQFRVGAYAAGDNNPWLIELVAGLAEPGEAVESVAQRETLEEAGMKISEIVPIIDYWSSPGASSEKVFLFCGRVDASQADGIHGVKEEGEDIKVVVMSCEEAFSKVKNGQISNALAIIGLQWLELNKEAIFCD